MANENENFSDVINEIKNQLTKGTSESLSGEFQKVKIKVDQALKEIYEVYDKFTQIKIQERINKAKKKNSQSPFDKTHIDITNHVSEEDVKNKMLNAYKIIKEIRSIVVPKEIEYGIFLLEENTESKQKKISYAKFSIEDLINYSKLSSKGILSMDQTIDEMKKILEKINASKSSADSTVQQWENLFRENSNDLKMWQMLEEVQQRMKKKRISYRYGQLIEAFIFLRNSDKEKFTTADVVDAIKQGANTTPAEISGDFELDGSDIQAKIISKTKRYSELFDFQRFDILKISSLKRVLENLSNVLEIVQINPKEVFNDSEEQSPFDKLFPKGDFQSSLKKGSETEIEKIVNDVLNGFNYSP